MSTTLRAAASAPLTVEAFLDWARGEPEGARYELVGGEAVAMAGDTVAHNRMKFRIARRLAEVLETAGSRCEVFIDGVGVVSGERSVRIPDVVVNCGEIDDSSVVAVTPLVVVEVASPSSEQRDLIEKLGDYALVPSIAQYLNVLPESRRIIWHRRLEGGGFHTEIMTSGEIALDPPGIRLAVDALLGDAE